MKTESYRTVLLSRSATGTVFIIPKKSGLANKSTEVDTTAETVALPKCSAKPARISLGVGKRQTHPHKIYPLYHKKHLGITPETGL